MSGHPPSLPSPSPPSSSLRTRRLVLRPVCLGDAADIARHADDRQIAEMTSRIPHPYSLGDAEAFLRGLGDERVFAVLDRATGTFIGVVGLEAAASPGTVELGYWIGRPFWNRGYATEAAQAMLDHAFDTLDQDEVEVRCRVVNGASRRVIEKCGFAYRGTGLALSLAAGRVASERYVMDRRCWLALKSWSAAS